MSDNQSKEAVALELMKVVIASDRNYFAGCNSREESKEACLALYGECFRAVKAGGNLELAKQLGGK